MRWVLTLLLSLLVSGQVQARHGIITSPAVVCNFLTGVATGTGGGTCLASPATCNGVADDTTAFSTFASWAISWQGSNTGQIELYIPPAANCQWTTSAIPFAGIKNLLVIGYGAKLGGNYFHLGAIGQQQDALHSTRLQTVSAGATAVFVNPSSSSQPAACSTIATCVALFSVGKWALITGVDTQSGIGFPSNPGFFQYVQVTAVNSSTGEIDFSQPLTATYKSTWPNYGTSGFDFGGPATLYALDSSWDASIEWRGVTFTNSNQLDANGRSVIFRDVTCLASGNACMFPSQNQSWSLYSGNIPNATMEADKIVESMTIDQSTISQITFQSASIHSATLNGVNITTVDGAPRDLTVTRSTIGKLIPGATTFGASRSLSIANSTITTFPNTAGSDPGGLVYQGSLGEGINAITGLSMASGQITIPNTYVTAHEGSVGWAIPGANICWADADWQCALVFQVTDITKDATNTYVQTSLSGGLPGWTYTGGKLWLRVHPAPQFTCTNCAGAAQLVDLSSAPAGLPLFSWDSRTYQNADTPNPTGFQVWGDLKTLTVAVNTAYTGSLAATATPNTLFGNYFNSTASALVTYTPAVVNLKVAGTRTLDASGGVPASWTGAQSGDTLTGLSQVLFANTFFPTAIQDLSGDPSHPMSVTVTVQTNQGVVVPTQ